MDLTDALFQLERGPSHAFASWPNDEVPRVAAGAYTVWDSDKLIYGGMAGRSLTVDQILEHGDDPREGHGSFSRLGSHASGRRSGDQFCVYVADLLVLPTLQPDTIARIAERAVRFGLVRHYVRAMTGPRKGF